jgi:hypothetical protein
MRRSNEWEPLLPKSRHPPKPPEGAAQYGAEGELDSPDAISSRLESMKPQPPNAVHFYQGEGLRWIRVGFDGDEPIKPEVVAAVGHVIASCVANSGPLFFHALRPHDMLFFLRGGKRTPIGMPAEAYGAPLDQVLHAWGLKTKPAKPGAK